MGVKKISPTAMEELSHFPYRNFGSTELRVSPICFGSLRLTPENEIYKESLRTALNKGINFIDSSGSYGDGASELLIGDVIQELTLTDNLNRSELVISTKLGTLHGKSLSDIKKRANNGSAFHGMIDINENIAHCISPDYIEHQLTSSLRRLSLSYVDVVFIQSPEMLFAKGYSKEFVAETRKKAFQHLEVEVFKGRIKYYGIASKALLKKDISNDYLNLQEIYEIASSIKKDHHFAALQIPFNLFETQALSDKNQNGKSLFQKAKELGLATVTCRPLTSHHRKKLHHFITFQDRDETKIKGELHQLLLDVVEMEKSLKTELSAYPSLDWAHYLKQNLEKICDLWKWTQYVQKRLEPRMNESLKDLPMESSWEIWRNTYLKKMYRITTLITHSLENISNLRTNQISNFLQERSEDINCKKLSNKVTQMYLCFDEIDSIVMGLGSPKYVDDLLAIQKIPQKEKIISLIKDVKMRF